MDQHFDIVFVLSAILWVPSLTWKIKVLDNNNQTTTPDTLTFSNDGNASASSSINSDDVPIGTAVVVTLTIIVVIVLLIVIIIMKRKKVNFPVICQRSDSNSTGSRADDGMPMAGGNAKQD